MNSVLVALAICWWLGLTALAPWIGLSFDVSQAIVFWTVVPLWIYRARRAPH